MQKIYFLEEWDSLLEIIIEEEIDKEFILLENNHCCTSCKYKIGKPLEVYVVDHKEKTVICETCFLNDKDYENHQMDLEHHLNIQFCFTEENSD